MTNVNVSYKFPLAGILGIIFIVLKLTGYIAWSWLWVLSPFWIPVVLLFVLFGGAFVLGTLGVMLSGSSRRKR